MESRGGEFLERFFYPESVAVVGASNNPLSLNHSLVANLVRLGFSGRIYLRPVFPPWEVLGNPFDLGVCVQLQGRPSSRVWHWISLQKTGLHEPAAKPLEKA